MSACGDPSRLEISQLLAKFVAVMNIKHRKKWKRAPWNPDIMIPYKSYYLSESYRDASGKPCKRSVLNIGELEGLSSVQIRELGKMLTEMIKTGQTVFGTSKETTELALHLYNKYRDKEKPAKAASEELAEMVEEQKDKDLRNRCWMNVDINSLKITRPRQIGAEHVCAHTAALLGFNEFLASMGWSREERNIATMQIIARAIYPYSELKTVSYLRENSALCEMFSIDPKKLTKDKLYKSAHHLYSVHEDMEDFLHERVCGMFSIEESVYILDITNFYAEGRYSDSELFQFGRSKEKRDDCKVVVLAAVVNADGLLVRTKIYEGNRADVTTVADIIGSLKLDRALSMGMPMRVVMDAGFNDENNLKWLKEHHIDYITVMRSKSSQKYTAKGDPIVVEDCRHQPIRIQMVELEGKEEATGGSVMLVDSDAKALKEQSMLKKASDRLEEDLHAVRAGIKGKGTKKRDALNRRLGRLNEKYGAVFSCYDIEVTYDEKEKDKATDMTWKKNEKFVYREKVHGKYLLQTSLPEDDPNIIWMTYNIVRIVEETFKVLKSDLDVRPIYHKTDDASKAHLNLAVLAYWIVSVTKYKLKLKDIDVRWSEILRVMSTQIRASVSMKVGSNAEVTTRKNSEPEEKLQQIYDALGITPNPRGTLVTVKSVGAQKPPPKKIESENQLVT